MAIDAYDVLNLSLDADEGEIKKAFRRLSLQHHPDKQGQQQQQEGGVDSNAKWLEIKAAADILQDQERRKFYDTFGLDVGDERPEMEVWTLGMGTLLSPLGFFTLKTFLMRVVFWLVSFRWIGYLVLLAGVVLAVLYAIDFKFKEFRVRSEEAQAVVASVGLPAAIVVVCWIWQVLADACGIFFLAAEVLDPATLAESWKVTAGAGLASLVVAWLIQNWWTWIVGLEVILGVVLLVALTVASGLMQLWIESIRTQHGDKLKDSRLGLRKMRKTLQDEVDQLKKKVQEQDKDIDQLQKEAKEQQERNGRAKK